MKRYLLKKRYIVVVVPFYSWFNIYFSLFLRVVMSDNEYNQWKIKIKPTGIKLNHKIVIKTLCSFNVTKYVYLFTTGHLKDRQIRGTFAFHLQPMSKKC